MSDFLSADYWEERYKNQKEKTFDWIEDYESLKSILDNLDMDKSKSKILNIGCGNAELSEDMYKNGYLNIDNIDISLNVINQMKDRCKDMDMNCKYI